MPLLPHSQGGNSSTGQVWSPNGQRIISTNSNNQTVDIRDSTPGQAPLTYRSHTTRLPATPQSHKLRAVAWSPDGKRIASADLSDRTVHIWDPTNGKPICIYYGYSDQISELIWSPDSEHIASFGLDKKEIYIWNSTRGETLCIYRGYITQTPPEHSAETLPVSPIVAKTKWGWAIPLTEQSTEDPPVQVLRWSPDGQYIASVGYQDKTVHIWNPIDGTTVYIYREHTSEIKTLAWSPDGKRIASAGDEVRIWQAI